jgi:N-dimethylarginine dimethylaminohydrolase
MRTYQTDVGQIKSILLKHAKDAFRDDEQIDAEWESLNYTARPDRETAIREYDAFVSLLDRFGMRLQFLPESSSVSLDSLYPRDNAISTDNGMILSAMGKQARMLEPQAHADYYQSAGIPILGRVNTPGHVEGGDVTWLTPRILAIANGYRTNSQGIAQVRQLLGDSVDEIIEVPLPHFRGPGDVFHLMSIISPVAEDIAVVYSPLMPVPFRNRLLDLGYRLVEVPEGEFESLGCNVLAMEPGVCVMVEGNAVTEKRLQTAGCEVHLIKGDEICRKGGGGPTCLTRPLAREI